MLRSVLQVPCLVFCWSCAIRTASEHAEDEDTSIYGDTDHVVFLTDDAYMEEYPDLDFNESEGESEVPHTVSYCDEGDASIDVDLLKNMTIPEAMPLPITEHDVECEPGWVALKKFVEASDSEASADEVEILSWRRGLEMPSLKVPPLTTVPLSGLVPESPESTLRGLSACES